MRHVVRHVAFAVATAATLPGVACGGAASSGPRPLGHHFDDMHIAAVALTDKQSVVEAQNDYSVARMERAKAEADLREIATQLDVAKNERAQALLEEKSAHAKKRAADKSGDLTRVNAAASERRAAELSRRAADEKISYLEAEQRALAAQLRYAEEHMVAEEARFELAKARIAHQRNIRPRGFAVGAYENQARERSQRAQRARAIAQRERKKADDRRTRWQAMVKAAGGGKGNGDGGGKGAPDGTR
jgi:hypothetical protein